MRERVAGADAGTAELGSGRGAAVVSFVGCENLVLYGTERKHVCGEVFADVD